MGNICECLGIGSADSTKVCKNNITAPRSNFTNDTFTLLHFSLYVQESPPLLKEDFLGERTPNINVLDQNVNPTLYKNSTVEPSSDQQVPYVEFFGFLMLCLNLYIRIGSRFQRNT